MYSIIQHSPIPEKTAVIRVPTFNPIEYLVNRKFPGFRRLEAPMTLSGIDQGGITSAEREKMYREIEEYRNFLETKDLDELNALVAAEKTRKKKRQTAWQRKLPRQVDSSKVEIPAFWIA